MSAEHFENGAIVRVGPAYRGSGVYAPDGCEGIHTVAGALSGGDYYLARGYWQHAPDRAHWDVIVNASRLTRVRMSERSDARDHAPGVARSRG